MLYFSLAVAQVFDCPKVFYMVMELMTGGELFDRIVEKEKYTESEAAAVVYKLAHAIKYCHDMGIVHRDLKVSCTTAEFAVCFASCVAVLTRCLVCWMQPENLLYSSKAPDAEIKIADFGLAKLLKESDMMATACGTPGYVGRCCFFPFSLHPIALYKPPLTPARDAFQPLRFCKVARTRTRWTSGRWASSLTSCAIP